MQTFQVNILDPKAVKLLKDMEEQNLITLMKDPANEFLEVLTQIRAKAKSDEISLDEITDEVEIVRTERHANKSR